MCNPFGVGAKGAIVSQGALARPWAVLSNPFGVKALKLLSNPFGVKALKRLSNPFGVKALKLPLYNPFRGNRS